ncbi:hypothetical protein D0Z08_27525 [Nocardioides immobilis]|uniref:Uncharacterized protein n=1 Tax=Nocardioides immobilis TaxID=2049295 RepID=A0A417XU67_9ACTN|nr:hypothetical protein [Nocardioides immobilis]RHW23845.1 hypothetical protein D0Z08_27525 [Nocardioides immobilis]
MHVVSGGTTTVPTNATTIRMTVTARGAAAGTLSFFPAGNPDGSSGQTVSWSAGGTATEVITTDIGQKNQVAFKNTSTKAAIVTATITGYSTEVEVDDISESGGTAGQVLTNTGTAAAWQDPQLPSAYHARNPSYVPLSGGAATVVSLALPAGRYQVEAITSGYGGGSAG